MKKTTIIGILALGICSFLNAHPAQAKKDTDIYLLMSGVRAATRPVAFRQKEESHHKGYDTTVGMTMHKGKFRVLVTSWGGSSKPTPKEQPEVFAEIQWQKQFLKEARKARGAKEWDVYVSPVYGTIYRGFINSNKLVVYHTTSKHHEKGYKYSINVVFYCGGWRILVTAYDNRVWPTEADWPEINQIISSMILPPAETPGQEWDTYGNQYVGYK